MSWRSVVVISLVVAVAALFLAFPADSSAAPRPVKPIVLQPGEQYYGKTYNELAGDWWNWALQFPEATNPVMDETGEFGALGQVGNIWFLAGTFGGDRERYLTVPPGKALFVPILNSIWWTPEDGGGSVEGCRAGANASINAGKDLWCTIDGQPVADIYAYRAQSPAGGFPFAILEGSILDDWGYTPRPAAPAVADGVWLLVDRLVPGGHTIAFHAAGDGFEVTVTYHLTVGVLQ